MRLNYSFEFAMKVTNKQKRLLGTLEQALDPIGAIRVKSKSNNEGIFFPEMSVLFFNRKFFKNHAFSNTIQKSAKQNLPLSISQFDLASNKAKLILKNPVDPIKKYSDATGRGARVAVLDTGFNFDAVKPKFIEETWSIDGKIGDIYSGGHGTQVASVISGFSFSIAPDAKLFLANIYPDGKLSILALIGAINWAVKKKCDLISISSGVNRKIGEIENDAICFAVTYAFDNNCLVIAAIGNKEINDCHACLSCSDWPGVSAIAICKNCFSVSGIDDDGQPSRIPYKNCLDVYERIDGVARYGETTASANLSRKSDSFIWGTSGATPIIAGNACLVVEKLLQNGKPTSLEVKAKLVSLFG